MIESVKYNAALAITGAIHCSSRQKLYQELGFNPIFFWGGGKITSPSRFLLITFVLLNILSPNFMTFIIFI